MPFSLQQINESKSTLPFLVYTPFNIDAITAPPLVVFLHGAGERGSDPSLILSDGLDETIERLALPAVILFPQCSLDYRFFHGAMEDRVMSAIDFVSRAYHTDPARIYLTGFSMGATSSLYLAARNPHKFAAIVSIAVGITWPGGIEWPPNLAEDENTRQLFRKMFVNDKRAQFIAEQIRDVPAWFFHGALDDACPIDESRQLHAELNKLGTATRLTEYPDLGHVCLNRSFTEAGLFDWLFSHSLALAGYSTN